jgi:hypothetical protein
VKQDPKIVRLDIQSEKILSKEQKKFNSFLKKIKKIKDDIEGVKVFYAQVPAWMEKIRPHELKQAEAKKKLVLALDASPFLKKLTRNQQEDFNEIIMNFCGELITEFQMDDLKPIFDKYSAEMSWEESEAEAKSQAAEMAKNMFGMDIDMDKMSDPEKQREELERIMREMTERKEKEKEEAETEQAQRANRKKSPKETERELKEAEAAKRMTKTTRQIYMELVKNFHPDQEQDETERVRKTEIMQQITAAYEKDDLLELLELQMTLLNKADHILQTMTDDSLKLYNKMLAQQVFDLEQEYRARDPRETGHPLAHFWNKNGNLELTDLLVRKHIKDMDMNLSALAFAAKSVQNNVKDLKNFIKVNKIEPDFDTMFDDIFTDSMFR